jgi:hypothetical protein
MSQDVASTSTPTAQPPVLVVRCDAVRGVVRVRGRLDRIGAELVAGQVDGLQLAGHRLISVQLPADGGDDEARALLTALVRRLEATGVRVRLTG